MSNKTNTVEYLEKPWGFHAVLSDVGHYKVKELIIRPGERLSYQTHQHRVERWLVLEGEGVVTLSGELVPVSMGSDVSIATGVAHRVENTGDLPLVILEAQFLVGESLSEDDIVRLSDDYGRDEGDWEEDTVEYIVRSKEAPSSN